MYKGILSDRRGNLASMLAILTFPMLAVVGMSIEYSNIASQRTKLQNAVDAAALFAGRHLKETGELPSQSDVEGFVDSNFEGSFSIAQFEKSDGTLHLSVDADVPPFFFGEIYPDVFDQNVAATVPYSDKSYLEIAMVLDTTGSMRGEKITTLKSVANSFVDKLDAVRNSENQVKIGLVPFNEHVNIGDGNKSAFWVEVVSDPDSWTPCVGTRPDPNILTDGLTYDTSGAAPTLVQFPAIDFGLCPAPLVELTDSTVQLKDGIAAMNARGSTYIGEGVAWGQRVLSSAEPLTQGKAMGSLGAGVRHMKVMLVLTDGDNSRGPTKSGPTNSRLGGVGDRYTKLACENARKAGIAVYSIVFGTSVSPGGKKVMQHCAGGAGGYFEAANAIALQGVFDEILAKLVALRLSS